MSHSRTSPDPPTRNFGVVFLHIEFLPCIHFSGYTLISDFHNAFVLFAWVEMFTSALLTTTRLLLSASATWQVDLIKKLFLFLSY